MGGGTTLVIRQRLIDRATAATVTLIAGPSGFGKTSLAIQLMALSQHGSVRVLIDQDATAAGIAAHIGQVMSIAGLSDLANALAKALADEDPDEALTAFVAAWAERADLLQDRPWLELESYGLPQLRAALSLIGDRQLATRPHLLVKATWVAEGRDPVTRRSCDVGQVARTAFDVDGEGSHRRALARRRWQRTSWPRSAGGGRLHR
ncbi:MAG: hypothetical protein ABIR32_20015 [Ilumatobacteraceae bacterium]